MITTTSEIIMRELLDSMKKSLPRYNAIQPSTGKKIAYRPFTVKEEKSLLMANSTGSYEDFLTTLADIVNSCFSLPRDARELPIFDIEYFFIKLRCKSIGEMAQPVIICPVTQEKINLDLNLDDIEPIKNANHSDVIKLDNMIVKMRYPTLEDFIQKKENTDYYDLLVDSIETIETAAEKIESKDCSRENLQEFVDLLSRDQFKKLIDFFKTMPKIEKEVTYRTSDGVERKLTLKGIRDFFQ